jgi:polyribonucleotide 5'-hydroxyl-kinase
VYFHGYTHPKDNTDLYRTLVTNLAGKLNDRLARDADARSSGFIVDTCGWIDGEGFNLIMHAIQALSIDVVLVMSHDKLYSNLGAALKGAGTAAQVTVVKLPRSGGVVTKV